MSRPTSSIHVPERPRLAPAGFEELSLETPTSDPGRPTLEPQSVKPEVSHAAEFKNLTSGCILKWSDPHSETGTFIGHPKSYTALHAQLPSKYLS